MADDRRVLFVTGGASGIGRATAKLFAERGWFVGVVDIDVEGLASLQEKLGEARCFTRQLDVSDKEAYDRATPDGAMRLVPPEEVAECVWQAYGSDRLHWYVPEEMENVERARAGGAEPLRDQFKKTVLGDG